MTETHDPIREWHAQKERAEMVLDVCAKVRSGETGPVVACLALLTAGVPEAMIPVALQEVAGVPPEVTDGPAEPRDAQPERLPNVEQRPSVSREPAAALFTTADAPVPMPRVVAFNGSHYATERAEAKGDTLTVRLRRVELVKPPASPEPAPVLPPGCRLESVGAQGWVVLNGEAGSQPGWGETPEAAAAAAWERFGAFMSREDYEALVRDAAARERDAQVYATIRTLDRRCKEAHEALQAQGLDGDMESLAERIGLLASRVGDAQAGEAYGREDPDHD